MNNLFQYGNFKLASGQGSNYKIECDALTKKDWDALALMAVDVLNLNGVIGKFGKIVGVPRGGIPFAESLKRIGLESNLPEDGILIAEDVMTTGRSMSNFKATFDKELLEFSTEGGYSGITAFARGKCPIWIYSVFQMSYEPRED